MNKYPEKGRERELLLEARQAEIEREQQGLIAKAGELARVEAMLDQSRRQLELERRELHAEMAMLLRRASS